MSRHHRRNQRFKLRSFYIWHRYIGVSAALLLIIASITGIALNHTEDLELDQKFVHADWLLDWYGIEAPEELLSYAIGDRYLSLMGEHLYLNRREIEGQYNQLIGVVILKEMVIVATDQSILLLTPRGEIIERMRTEDGVPGGIKKIGLDQFNNLVVNGNHDFYQPDADFIKWNRVEVSESDIEWATTVAVPDKLKMSLRQHYRTEVLPIERVVLDMHSGRFLGSAGPWLMDAAAIALILLSLSGSWMWFKRRR